MTLPYGAPPPPLESCIIIIINCCFLRLIYPFLLDPVCLPLLNCSQRSLSNTLHAPEGDLAFHPVITLFSLLS